MAPTGQAYFTDWIWSNTSNVHSTNHRDWFIPGTFVEFDSHFGDVYGMGKASDDSKVLGIGDVELSVKAHAKDNEGNKIILRNVLYTPGTVCNIFGPSIADDYELQVSFGKSESKITELGTGRTLGLLDRPRLLKLWLVKHAKGRTVLDPNTIYMINVHWADEERARYATYLVRRLNSILGKEQKSSVSKAEPEPKTKVKSTSSTTTAFSAAAAPTCDVPSSTKSRPNVASVTHTEASSSKSKAPSVEPATKPAIIPPYTTEEKAWLKKHWKDEYHFLIAHELNIFHEDDREEGRLIVRAQIEGEKEDQDPECAFDPQEARLRDIEIDPESHIADHFFNAEELEWIRLAYGHSENFLRQRCLEPTIDWQCRMGKVMLGEVMRKGGKANRTV